MNKKNIIISGSAKLQVEIEEWISILSKKYNIIDYPKRISSISFIQEYPKIYKDFFKNLLKAEILFILNEDKNGISGYIGAQTFAELSFIVANNRLKRTNTEIILLKHPSASVQSYTEINLWLKLGWIKLLQHSELSTTHSKIP